MDMLKEYMALCEVKLRERCSKKTGILQVMVACLLKS